MTNTNNFNRFLAHNGVAVNLKYVQRHVVERMLGNNPGKLQSTWAWHMHAQE